MEPCGKIEPENTKQDNKRSNQFVRRPILKDGSQKVDDHDMCTEDMEGVLA